MIESLIQPPTNIEDYPRNAKNILDEAINRIVGKKNVPQWLVWSLCNATNDLADYLYAKENK